MGKGKCVAVLVALFMSVFTEWAAGSSGEAELYVEKKNYYVESGRKYINIFYPQIHGIGDGGREECINTIIKDDALKQVREDLSYDLVHGLDYEIKFLDEKLVSIVYEGYYGACGGRLPPTAFTTTVDITGEKLLKLKDVVTDLEILGEMLLEDRFENVTMWDGMKGDATVGESYSKRKDDLFELLQAEEWDMIGSNVSWYTDGAHFVILLDEGLTYNEFSIDISEVEDILDKGFLEKLDSGDERTKE